MLSQLKSYLFGGGDDATVTSLMTPPSSLPQSSEASFIINSIAGRAVEEEDWVLVDSQDANGEMPDGLELVTSADCEESWIFTQNGVNISARTHSGKARRHQRNQQQPKGTKPRRWKGINNKPSHAGRSGSVEDDAESTSSSIAIVPSPKRDHQPAATPAAAATVLAASVDAQQVAAISAARSAKVKVDKNWLSRNSLMRNNQTAMAATAGRNQRRGQLMVSRLCGSNNNRKSHQY